MRNLKSPHMDTREGLFVFDPGAPSPRPWWLLANPNWKLCALPVTTV